MVELCVMLFCYTVLFLGLLVTVVRSEYEKYYIAAKGVNSAAFVAVFCISGYLSCEIRQFYLMLPAFVCCFSGDILMGMYHRFGKKIQFLMGLAVFLAGHLFFLRWMCRMQPISAADFIFPAFAVPICCLILWGMKMETGRLLPFILVYTFFVSLLFAKGVHLAAAAENAGSLVIAAGGALFLISDISILFLYFWKKHQRGVHIFNLATYYYAVFLFAVCLLF